MMFYCNGQNDKITGNCCCGVSDILSGINKKIPELQFGNPGMICKNIPLTPAAG